VRIEFHTTSRTVPQLRVIDLLSDAKPTLQCFIEQAYLKHKGQAQEEPFAIFTIFGVAVPFLQARQCLWWFDLQIAHCSVSLVIKQRLQSAG
jgi:hypothetical protein